MFYVYFLQSQKGGQYYVGSTSQPVIDRPKDHNNGKNVSTRRYRPWKLLRVERYAALSEARKRELAIKRKKSRKMIELIINR